MVGNLFICIFHSYFTFETFYILHWIDRVVSMLGIKKLSVNKKVEIMLLRIFCRGMHHFENFEFWVEKFPNCSSPFPPLWTGDPIKLIPRWELGLWTVLMCLVTKPNQTLVPCAVTLLAVEMGWGPSIKTGTKEKTIWSRT